MCSAVVCLSTAYFLPKPHFRPGELCPGERVVWVFLKRVLEGGDRALRIARRPAIHKESTLEKEVVCGHVVRWRSFCRSRDIQLYFEGPDHLVRDVVLYLEKVLDLAVVGLRPDVFSVLSPHELCSDPQSVARPAHTAFQNAPDLELCSDAGDVVRLTFE